MTTDVSSFGREAGRVADQVAHWSPARWRIKGRGDVMHALIQVLADLDADAEGRPRIAVPRLPYDTALADQLRVVAADLCAADPAPSALAAAREALARARAALF